MKIEMSSNELTKQKKGGLSCNIYGYKDQSNTIPPPPPTPDPLPPPPLSNKKTKKITIRNAKWKDFM